MGVELRSTSLSSVLIVTPKRFGDHRGFFEETWNAGDLKEYGIDILFVQDNHSYSQEKGTLRGLHYQAPPHAQDKLVRCTRGAIFDVAVDVRKGSPTYGQWVGEELSRENGWPVLTVDRKLKERLINTGGSYIEVTSKNVLRLIQN